MTHGSVLGRAALFALPICAGNILQLLYSTVDTLVIGNFCDTTALASVATSSQPLEILLCVFVGIGSGISILVSQAVGRADHDQLQKLVRTSVWLLFAASLPLTVTEWDEWGDPLHDADVYRYMKSYSPYENAPEGADGEAGAGAASTRSLQRQSLRPFPRIFATTSMNDTRVLYVEPLKWVSRLQAAGIDAIIKIEVEAGHGGTSGRYKQWREVSYENAWCLSVMGLTR